MSNEIPLLMPKMSMTMTEGELSRWLKSEGDHVNAGDVVCEVMTDKVDMEVESPVEGVISRIVISEGEVLPVGEPIAFITSDSDDLLGDLLSPTPDSQAVTSTSPSTTGAQDTAVPVAGSDAVGSAEAVVPPADSELPAADAPTSVTDTPVMSREQAAPAPAPATPAPAPASTIAPVGIPAAVPRARGLARAAGLDLAGVRGSGPDGLITVADVEQALGTSGAAQPATAAPVTARPPALAPRPTPAVEPVATTPADDKRRATVRQRVGAVMTQSAAIPQFTAWREFDLEPLSEVRSGISWNTLLVRALAMALRSTPALNGTFVDGAFAPGPNVAIGLAVDSAVGLLAPTLVDPDLVDVEELDAELRAMVQRARTGKVDARYLVPATTALSNLGTLGVERFNAMLTPPQVTALSVGSVMRRPVAHAGGIALRTTATMGLTVDHRAADGADAARLLATLADLLADPQRLIPAAR